MFAQLFTRNKYSAFVIDSAIDLVTLLCLFAHFSGSAQRWQRC